MYVWSVRQMTCVMCMVEMQTLVHSTHNTQKVLMSKLLIHLLSLCVAIFFSGCFVAAADEETSRPCKVSVCCAQFAGGCVAVDTTFFMFPPRTAACYSWTDWLPHRRCQASCNSTSYCSISPFNTLYARAFYSHPLYKKIIFFNQTNKCNEQLAHCDLN